jgi:hypothetical protein
MIQINPLLRDVDNELISDVTMGAGGIFVSMVALASFIPQSKGMTLFLGSLSNKFEGLLEVFRVNNQITLHNSRRIRLESDQKVDSFFAQRSLFRLDLPFLTSFRSKGSPKIGKSHVLILQ